jgi:NADH-quinone oxidoreductase subunit N
MVFVLLMACYLLVNDDLLALNFFKFFNIINHFAFFSLNCSVLVAMYFLFIGSLKYQRITPFEYLLVLMFAVLGLMLLCSSNDLLTAYLAIELSSLSFYILASFKSSNYSVEGGIYFVTGAVSSAFLVWEFVYLR